MRLRKFRLERQRAVEALDRLIEAVEIAQRIAAIDQRVGEVRPERQGAIVTGERGARAVEFEIGIGAVAIDIGIVGIELERAVEARQRVLVPADVAQHVADVVVQRRGIRAHQQGAIVVGKRRDIGLHRVVDIAARDERIGVVVLERERPIETRQRRLVALELARDAAVQSERGDVGGLEFKGVLDVGERLLIASDRMQQLRSV